MAEEKELRLRLNGSATAYAADCPECNQTGGLKNFNLPSRFRPEAVTVARNKRCWACKAEYTVRYSLLSDPSEATRQGKEGFDWPLVLKAPAVRTKDSPLKGDGAPAPGPVDTEEVKRLANEAVNRGIQSVVTQVQTFKEQMERTVRDAERRAQERLKDSQPTVIQVHVEGEVKLEAELKTRHKAYLDVMDRLMSNGKVLMVGPPGSGKSTMPRQMAEDIGYEFTFQSCTEGISEAHILGRMTPDGVYLPSAFVQGFEGSGKYAPEVCKGVLHLWDEADAMDANTGLSINEALSNGHLSLPNRPSDPFARMRANYLQAAACNTWLTGGQVEFSGRNVQDAAFVDRFAVLKVWVDYDVERERRIAEAGKILGLAEALWKVRANVQQHGIRRPVSTRAFINSAKLRLYAPDRWSEARLLGEFFAGWPTAEKAKAIEGVTLGHQEPGSGR